MPRYSKILKRDKNRNKPQMRAKQRHTGKFPELQNVVCVKIPQNIRELIYRVGKLNFASEIYRFTIYKKVIYSFAKFSKAVDFITFSDQKSCADNQL